MMSRPWLAAAVAASMLVAFPGGTLAAKEARNSSASAAETAALETAERDYPKCTLSCLAQLIPKSECSATDLACLCTNVPLNTNLTICVTTTCTTYEQLSTKNTSLTMCGANKMRNEGNSFITIAFTGYAIAAVFFLLRMASLLPGRGRMAGLDDLFIIIGMAIAFLPTVFAIPLVNSGLGRDLWTLKPSQIEKVLFFYYLGEIAYVSAQVAVKLSLLFFLIRVFGQSSIKTPTYWTMAFCVAYGVSFVVAVTFQCVPVPGAWKVLDDSYAAKCNNLNVLSWLTASFNIVLDIIIVVLPQRELFQLHVSLRKKLMIIAIFCCGAAVVIFSIVRLVSLVRFAHTTNPTWDYHPTAYMSTLELDLAIITACLPAARTFLVNLGVRGLDTIHRTTMMTGAATKPTAVDKSGGSIAVKSFADKKPRHGDEEDFIPLKDIDDSGMKSPWAKTDGTLITTRTDVSITSSRS